MLTRREFLVAGAEALGGWLVGAEVARRILHLARERRAPYLVEVDQPDVVLYANRECGGYVLTRDYPWGKGPFEQPTWGDWFELRGVNGENPEQVRKHLIEWDCYEVDEEAGEVFVCPRLEDPLPAGLLGYYQTWDLPNVSCHRLPEGRAYDYLAVLPLQDHSLPGPDPLGSLEFVDGCCPGNDAYRVQAKGVATLGGLQQRLLQLGQRVDIRLVGKR